MPYYFIPFSSYVIDTIFDCHYSFRLLPLHYCHCHWYIRYWIIILRWPLHCHWYTILIDYHIISHVIALALFRFHCRLSFIFIDYVFFGFHYWSHCHWLLIFLRLRHWLFDAESASHCLRAIIEYNTLPLFITNTHGQFTP